MQKRMMIVGVSAALLAAAAPGAFADDKDMSVSQMLVAPAGLTWDEAAELKEACEADGKLVPVAYDNGTLSGEYALPVFDDDGQAIAADIFTERQLELIPACADDIARPPGQQMAQGEHSVS